jgi:serine beta-lactamase-like protein LACTB, mitochondrial
MQTVLALMLIAAGLLVTLVLGVHTFMTMTATPWHPDPLGVPSAAHSKPPREWATVVERARQIVRTEVAEQNLPGLSVAVGLGHDIVWAEGFGWADLERQMPVEPNHRFRIGTASTVLTSAALGVLLEQGRVNLDDEIQTHVPDFPSKEWPVTLRQLMGHLAGLRTDGGDESPLYAQHCSRPVEALSSFADRTLLFEPGTHYRYSNYGWILVSAAVEAAADEPFLTFMEKKVFEPLGMHDTRADSITEPIPDRVKPYFPRYSADPAFGLHPMRDIDLSCYAGAGAFLSTPSDLVRFGMAMNAGKLLQPATVETLQTSQRLPSGEETGYGLGWDLENVTLAGESTRVVGHDGEVLGGMVASLLTHRDRGIVVAVTSNISYADTFAIAAKIAEAFDQEGDVVARRR